MRYIISVALTMIILYPSIAFGQSIDDGRNAVGNIDPGDPSLEIGGNSPPEKLSQYVSTIINTAIVFGLIAFLIYLVYGGTRWIMSGGDPKAHQAAQGIMTNAFIGMILLSIAYAIGWVVQNFIGYFPDAPSGPPVP